MARKAQDPFTVVSSHLGELTVGELEEVGAMVEALLSIRQREEEREKEEVADKTQVKAGARGHIELKTINGYGPYQYLRYWQGKTLKSKYIGKAKG